MTNQTTQGGNMSLLLEAERRGILPPDKQQMLAEARKRGLVPQAQQSAATDGTAGSILAQSGQPAAPRQTGEFVTIDTQTGPVRLPSGMSRQDMAAALNKLETPDRYRTAAQKALDAGDTTAAKRLIARGTELEVAQGGNTEGQVGDAGGMSGAALDGAMLGFGDEYLAGLSSVLGVQPDGEGGANWFDYSKPIGERYSTALDAIRSEQQGYAEENPGKALAAEIVGSLVGPGKGGATFINAGKGTASRVGRGAVVGGGTGAAYGFGEGEDGIENRTVGSLISAPVGVVGGGALVGAGQGFNKALNAIRGRGDDAVPTVEGLRNAAKGLYDRARDLGGELSGDEVAALNARAGESIRDAGFDKQLHPRFAAVVDRISGETGPKSLQEMEILRRVARNAAESLQPDERRIASQIIDHIDDAVDGMGGGSPALSEARDTWARVRRMEVVEDAIERASLQDNFAAGLRNQFKSLLRNPRKLRGFSDADKKLIRQVANGSTSVKALRGLSSILSPTTLPGMAIAGGTAFAGPGVVPAMGVDGAGLGTKAIADALTRGAAQRARSGVGQNPAQRRIMEELLKRSNPVARGATAAGLSGGAFMEGPR